MGVESELSWYQQAEDVLAGAAVAVQRRECVDVEVVSRLARYLVDAIRGNDRLVVVALSSPPGSPQITNLINVGILGTKIGLGLGFYGTELHHLALAALLHDIGVFALSPELMSKDGRFTGAERAVLEEHPRLGAEIIERLGGQYSWLARVVLQAHERGNGQGYPNRIKGREIHELAQLIGLVDIFDALISPRSYRRRLTPHEAVRELLNSERTAFPREMMKALVEQLSVFPLGTRVRLSSGEEGVVVRVSPRYPARPVVRVLEGEADAEAHVSHDLNLSLLPQVSVVQTVDPPALARISLPMRESASGQPPSARTIQPADRFAALLDNLDAIANVIRAAVERSVPSTALPSSFSRPRAFGNATAEIRREVLGLFLLEAREWLAQIHTALDRLERPGTVGDRAKVGAILWHCLTNLAKSAGAVGLCGIEDKAGALLALLGPAEKQEMAAAARQVGSLREGLQEIFQILQQVPGEQSGHESIPAVEQSDRAAGNRMSDRETSPVISRGGPPSFQAQGTSQHTSLIEAMWQLHAARARSAEPKRDVLGMVIREAEQEGERTGRPIDVAVITDVLAKLDEWDRQFLVQVHRHVPALIESLGAVMRDVSQAAVPMQSFAPSLAHIDLLCEEAARVSASNLAVFLNGLRTFFRITAEHKPATVRQRLAAVAERLHSLIPLAQQWVDIGKVEREAISAILPKSDGS